MGQSKLLKATQGVSGRAKRTSLLMLCPAALRSPGGRGNIRRKDGYFLFLNLSSLLPVVLTPLMWQDVFLPVWDFSLEAFPERGRPHFPYLGAEPNIPLALLEGDSQGCVPGSIPIFSLLSDQCLHVVAPFLSCA